MNNMIAVVLGVILMVAAAIAGFTYFGPALDEGQGYSELASYSGKTLQVDGAYRAYLVDHDGAEPDGTDAQKVQALVDGGYLESAPDGSFVFLQNRVFEDISADTRSCRRINKAALKDVTPALSYEGCPPCDDVAFKSWPGCTRDTTASAAID